MSKTACKAQCSECPFRNTALPGYLGSYTISEYIEILWHKSAPLFCHSTINYERTDWLAQAQANGKLCRGALIAGAAFGGEVSPDPDITAAQNAVMKDFAAQPESYDVMPVREFRDHHMGGIERLLLKGPDGEIPQVQCTPPSPEAALSLA